MDTTLTLLALAASGVTLATVVVYERMVARLRAERDEAIADCELFSELLIDHARERHPSYGGGNLRVIDGGAS